MYSRVFLQGGLCLEDEIRLTSDRTSGSDRVVRRRVCHNSHRDEDDEQIQPYSERRKPSAKQKSSQQMTRRHCSDVSLLVLQSPDLRQEETGDDED